MFTPQISLFTLAWCLTVSLSQGGRAAYSRIPQVPLALSRDITLPYGGKPSQRGSAIPHMLQVQISEYLLS